MLMSPCDIACQASAYHLGNFRLSTGSMWVL